MNTKEIEYILNCDPNTKKYFDGVYSIDTLKDINVKPSLIICNTDPSFKTGKHWVLFYFYDNMVDFFDSLGHEPNFYGQEFITFMEKFAKNCNLCLTRIQPPKSTLCGHYCILFAKM